VLDLSNKEPETTSPLLLLIEGCKTQDRDSQRLLYQHYYAYAMSICQRYSRTREEAREILNDGFMKVFSKIDQYNPETSFLGWIRRIMINTAIDQYRKEEKHYNHSSLETSAHSLATTTTAIEDLSHQELMSMVKELTPGYRAVFNLYVIDGYNHKEIAGMLGISEGTSKSNLMKAREVLRTKLEKLQTVVYAKSI
jgi:RNA polymerase sigma factor (sigma-70 family)